MKLLGTAAMAAENKLIVGIEQLPPLRKKVCNEEGKIVGAVIDYIGQTKKPFAVVQTDVPANDYTGKKLYLMESLKK